MKLVDGHNEGQGNLKEEVACEAKPTTLKRPNPGDGFENHMHFM